MAPTPALRVAPGKRRRSEATHVESRATLEAAAATSIFTHGLDRDAPGPGATAMQERPGLDGEVAGWRRLAGCEMRPAGGTHRHAELDRPSVAWLELQFWWRHGFLVSSDPPDPWLALSCVKLVAAPLRVLMWLEDGDRRGTRVDVLEEARRRMPEQERAIAHALDLSRRLPAAPVPDTGLVVRALAEISERVARRIGGVADVRGHETVAPLMILPTTDGAAARQRCAQCPASDPVSFAVASGHDQAAFPELPGWSARDAAKRAVDEHAVRLPRDELYRSSRGEAVARLLAAARAALLAQSCASGMPALALTATATATALVEEGGADRTTADEALGWYMDGRALPAYRPDRGSVPGALT